MGSRPLPCRCWRISVLHGVVWYQLFSWWLWLPCFLEVIDKILRCSSGQIPHHSHDQWNSRRWNLSWSPRSREIDSYFVFLGNGLVTHSSLLYVYNLVPDILRQLFILGHGGEFGIWLIDRFCGQVVFYTGNKLRLGALLLRECS